MLWMKAEWNFIPGEKRDRIKKIIMASLFLNYWVKCNMLVEWFKIQYNLLVNQIIREMLHCQLIINITWQYFVTAYSWCDCRDMVT